MPGAVVLLVAAAFLVVIGVYLVRRAILTKPPSDER